MSFDIDWEKFKDGLEQDKLKQFLNDKFESTNRPGFLGPIQVTELDLGTIPPEIAVEDICDPLEEFYYEEDVDYIEYTDRQESFVERQRDPSDCQLEVSIHYSGDLRMSITTALIINQPTPGFMILPLSLTVTRLELKATAIIAYLGDMINFCLKEDEILQDMKIESTIGDQNVLNNVGKIEQFIVQQLRKFLNDYIVFPNYHTIFLEEED